ncbi:CMRF35-like molecule 8 isoform X2 [Channa argus]|uniref:CMRF35-like molecule 8 isoform X2 n=1 Tax=Channa argus TaxID=215402 RepID=UPI003521D4F9
MMKSFFLLLLSVMAGCDHEYEVNGCRGGWVEFICVYPEGQKTYKQIDVVHRIQTITTTVKDKWENKGRIFLYHNTTAKYLKVLIKQLQPEDFEEDYKCKFNGQSESFKEVELKYEFKNCQTPLPEIVTRTDKVTFTCDMSENLRQNDTVKFFCKENDFFICEDILPTNSSPKSNRRFTVTDTNSGFIISISDVSSEDAGVYWCGVKSDQGNDRSAFRQIQLQVLTPPTTSTPSITTSVASDQTTTGETNAPQTTSTPSITTSVASDQTTTGPAETHGDSQVGVTAAVVCAAVLAVVILLVLFFIRSKTRRNKAEKQKNKEKDHSYAEIQEPPQKTDPGAAMKTVYATANFPTNPSAFMDYSEITFKNISEEVNSNIYSTVRDNDQNSTYATVHDSKPSL